MLHLENFWKWRHVKITIFLWLRPKRVFASPARIFTVGKLAALVTLGTWTHMDTSMSKVTPRFLTTLDVTRTSKHKAMWIDEKLNLATWGQKLSSYKISTSSYDQLPISHQGGVRQVLEVSENLQQLYDSSWVLADWITAFFITVPFFF